MSDLRMAYLPINQCWTFVFGTALVGMGDRLLFDSADAAIEAAREHGLLVQPDGRTEAIPTPASRGGAP